MLADPSHRRVDEGDAFGGHRRLIELQQELHLFVERHFQRVLLERALPRRGHRGDRRERDALALEARVGLCDVDRCRGHAARLVDGHLRARRESPGAVDEHADAEADTLVARDVLHLLLAGRHRLGAQTVDAHVGVDRAQTAGCLQRRVGDVVADRLDGARLRRLGLENPRRESGDPGGTQ